MGVSARADNGAAGAVIGSKLEVYSQLAMLNCVSFVSRYQQSSALGKLSNIYQFNNLFWTLYKIAVMLGAVL